MTCACLGASTTTGLHVESAAGVKAQGGHWDSTSFATAVCFIALFFAAVPQHPAAATTPVLVIGWACSLSPIKDISLDDYAGVNPRIHHHHHDALNLQHLDDISADSSAMPAINALCGNFKRNKRITMWVLAIPLCDEIHLHISRAQTRKSRPEAHGNGAATF